MQQICRLLASSSMECLSFIWGLCRKVHVDVQLGSSKNIQCVRLFIVNLLSRLICLFASVHAKWNDNKCAYEMYSCDEIMRVKRWIAGTKMLTRKLVGTTVEGCCDSTIFGFALGETDKKSGVTPPRPAHPS